MKMTCTVCDSCLADGAVTLATHSYDSSARRNIHVCEECAEAVLQVHLQHPDDISEPWENPSFNQAP